MPTHFSMASLYLTTIIYSEFNILWLALFSSATDSCLQNGLLPECHLSPIHHRINFKVATPTPLSFGPIHTLCSSSHHVLPILRSRTQYAIRAFSFSAPAVWNFITGSPAELSRVNGVRLSSAKAWNFNPSPKSQFYFNQFGVSDNVREVNSSAKFGTDPISGRDATWGQNIRILWLFKVFFYFFYSST